MQNLKFGGVTVLAVQLFNKIKRKEKKEKKKKKKMTKNMFRCISRMLYRNTFILVNLFFFVCFRLEMEIT